MPVPELGLFITLTEWEVKKEEKNVPEQLLQGEKEGGRDTREK